MPNLLQITFCSVSCPILSYLVLICPILSYPVLICPYLSYPILSCPILPYPVLSCPILSYPVLSCSIPSYTFISLNNVDFICFPQVAPQSRQVRRIKRNPEKKFLIIRHILLVHFSAHKDMNKKKIMI